MIDLLLAVTCGLGVGVVFKVAALRGIDRVAMLTVNYAVAVILAASLLRGTSTVATDFLNPGLLLLSLGTGGLFIAGYVVFGAAVAAAGMSLAVGVMRISVVLPFLASWLIWEEIPTATQFAGLSLASLSFFLIAHRQAKPGSSQAHLGEFGILALLFAVNGAVDIAVKTFDEHFGATYDTSAFLLLVFGMAFAIGLARTFQTSLRSAARLTGAVLISGVVLGLLNYASTAFFLRAIRQLEGPFVFPANHISLILGSALLGVLIWGERPSRLNWIGLLLASVALVLISVGVG